MASVHSLPIEIMPIIFMEGALLPIGSQASSLVQPFIGEDIWDPSTCDPIPFACDVSQVCSLWREIALSTPALWSKVCFTDALQGFAWPQELLRRSKANIVDLYVDIAADWTEKDVSRCMELVSSVMDRCRSLVVTSSGGPRLSGIHYIVVDALEAAPSALALEYLDLRGLLNERSWVSFLHNDAPNLRTLLTRYCDIDSSVSGLASTLYTLDLYGNQQRVRHHFLVPLVFPNMHILSVTDDGLCHLPPRLECPNLRAMIISFDRDAGEHGERGLVPRLSQRPLLNMLAGLTHVSLFADDRLDLSMARTLYCSFPNIHVLRLHVYETSRLLSQLGKRIDDVPDEPDSEESSGHFHFLHLGHLVLNASSWLDVPADLVDVCGRRAAAGLRLKRLTVEQVSERRVRGGLRRSTLDVDTLCVLPTDERFQLRIGRAEPSQ